MNDHHRIRNPALATAVLLASGAALAQQDRQTEPVVPVGPPAVPVKPAGPAVVPAVPLERVEGVETVTLDTPRGPVVVVSFPVSGNVASSDYNIDFSRLDADRDGYVTRGEIESAKGSANGAVRKLQAQFAAVDATGDGKLSFMELIDWVY